FDFEPLKDAANSFVCFVAASLRLADARTSPKPSVHGRQEKQSFAVYSPENSKKFQRSIKARPKGTFGRATCFRWRRGRRYTLFVVGIVLIAGRCRLLLFCLFSF